MRDALALLQALVLEDGRRWGDAAAGFQLEDARSVLDQSAAPYSFLTRARGAAKTSDLAGMLIAAMLTQAPAGSRLYGLAADRDQARLLVDSVRGYVERTPELQGRVVLDAFKVRTDRGVVLEALAADAASSWGLRPWFVVADVDCERGNLFARNIRRIAHDRVELLARDWCEEIAQSEIDSI